MPVVELNSAEELEAGVGRKANAAAEVPNVEVVAEVSAVEEVGEGAAALHTWVPRDLARTNSKTRTSGCILLGTSKRRACCLS